MTVKQVTRWSGGLSGPAMASSQLCGPPTQACFLLGERKHSDGPVSKFSLKKETFNDSKSTALSHFDLTLLSTKPTFCRKKKPLQSQWQVSEVIG